LFSGNSFWQWKFFSFTCSGSVFTASSIELPLSSLTTK
jgi:hypothetical protein